MPPAVLTADSDHETHAGPCHENFEFLEPPWEVRNGECVVKGSSRRFVADESGGPVSKYAALFDGRSEIDSLRVSFLHATCGK